MCITGAVSKITQASKTALGGRAAGHGFGRPKWASLSPIDVLTITLRWSVRVPFLQLLLIVVLLVRPAGWHVSFIRTLSERRT